MNFNRMQEYIEESEANRKKVSDTINAAIDLEMKYSDIIKEVRTVSGLGIVEAENHIVPVIMEQHKKGNKKATKIAEDWNSIRGREIFKL